MNSSDTMSLAAKTTTGWPAQLTPGQSFFERLKKGDVMIHQPYGGVTGQTTDIQIQAEQIIKDKRQLNDILARHTGQPLDKVVRDTDRDFFMAPDAAKEYGIIDAVYAVESSSLIAKAHDAGRAGGEDGRTGRGWGPGGRPEGTVGPPPAVQERRELRELERGTSDEAEDQAEQDD